MESQALIERAEAALARQEYAAAEEQCSQLLIFHPSCVPAYQLLARIWLARGERENFDRALSRRDELPRDEHYPDWGFLAEEAGDLSLAMEIYSHHLRHFPQDAVVLYRLGMLHLEKGERRRAFELLGDAVQAKPDFTEALLELAQGYVDDEWWGLAAQAYRQILEHEPEHLEARAGLQWVEARMQELAELPQAEPDQDGRGMAEMLRLFAGREGVHARQWVDPSGKTGYSPVHEPLNERLLGLHLKGEITLGVYPVRNDNTVLFGAIDIDLRKAALQRSQENEEMRRSLERLVQADALRLRKFCDHLHLPLYAEDSGYKGIHLWLFLAEPMPAGQIKRFLEAVVQRAGPPSPELQWEVFPKQEKVEAGSLGNLIKLPLGVHQKTGRRCLFVDGNGQAYADQAALLARVERVDRTRFEQAMSRLVQSSTDSRPVPPPGAEAAAVFPEFKPLFEGCGVIRALEEKARVTHHLTHEERLVLKCVLAHVGEPGQALVHAIVGQCLDYVPKITQQQLERTPPSPISCPKIRQRLPEITATVNCACAFELPEDGYPSPLLYLGSHYTRGKAQYAGQQASLLERYVQLRREAQKVRQELAQVERELRYLLQSRGVDHLKAGGWVLRRGPEDRLLVEIEAE